jgi:hypothetical protein
MSEDECRDRLYGGPRTITVIRADVSSVTTLPRIRRLLGRRDRKAA